MGWTAESTTLTVTVPAGVSGGTYDLAVTGVNQARSKTLIVPITVTNDGPPRPPRPPPRPRERGRDHRERGRRPRSR